jgi:hypothetical protein
MQLEGYHAFSEDYLWHALSDVKAVLGDLIARWEALLLASSAEGRKHP